MLFALPDQRSQVARDVLSQPQNLQQGLGRAHDFLGDQFAADRQELFDLENGLLDFGCRVQLFQGLLQQDHAADCLLMLL
ncbi:hypothetical protein D3C76_1623480 [compost metagenome]